MVKLLKRNDNDENILNSSQSKKVKIRKTNDSGRQWIVFSKLLKAK